MEVATIFQKSERHEFKVQVLKKWTRVWTRTREFTTLAVNALTTRQKDVHPVKCLSQRHK